MRHRSRIMSTYVKSEKEIEKKAKDHVDQKADTDKGFSPRGNTFTNLPNPEDKIRMMSF